MVEKSDKVAVYKDSARSMEKRVADLLKQMTVEEKIAQLTSIWLHFNPNTGAVSPHGDRTVEFDPEYYMRSGIGQITRPFGSQPIDPVEGAKMVNDLQKRLVENTRLGIPAICHEECLTGFMAQGATSFASPLNFGSTWDPGLIERVGDCIRRQMRSVGSHQGLAPVADVARDPRWGRIEETVSEDPYLVGCMVSSYVKGLQGNDLKEGVIATLKHFAGYSFSEGGRNFAPAHVGRREFFDMFLVPFEMAIKGGGAHSVMNAYQEIDGEAPAASKWLLTEVLRDMWGFKGFVVSDYGAVTFLHRMHRVAEGQMEAASSALLAGLDVELPSPAEYPEGLKSALDKGLIKESDLDISVHRVLTAKFSLGLFESPYVDTDAIQLDLPEERALAKKVAEKSITLLSNNGILPISRSIAKIAVIGPNADDIMALFGNYSFENHIVSTHFPDAADDIISAPTVLDVMKERISSENVGYAEGCQIMTKEKEGIKEAVSLAEKAEVALVVVGDKAGHFGAGTVGEGTDTSDLSLPGAQEDLIHAVIDTKTPTIIVLLNGRPFAMPEIAEKAAAIIEAWFPGQDGANAIVDVLFGDINPGGKTTLTFSKGAGFQPFYYNHKFLAKGIPNLPDISPVFPFGHGLSYTSFDYSDFLIKSSNVPNDGEAVISCNVKNSGGLAGDEVVQLYLRDEFASITRPVIELKGFVRVHLLPGETKKITFYVPSDLLSFTGVEYKRIVEPGEIIVKIGSSSADIRLKGKYNLTGSTRETGEDRELFTRVEVASVAVRN